MGWNSRNVNLQNFKQYFSISVQYKHWIFSSPEAFCDRSHKRKHYVRSRCINTIATVPDFVPNVMVSNIRGGLCSKLDEIATVLEHNAISVACLPETWLQPSIANELIQLDNYVCYWKDRSDGRQGAGVALCVRNTINCTRLESFEVPDLETMWILYRKPKMYRNLSHILIGAVYHPPSGNNSRMITHILHCLDRCSKDQPNVCVLLMRDFNCLPDNSLKAFPLKQIVRAPTRGRPHLIKYTLILLIGLLTLSSVQLLVQVITQSWHLPQVIRNGHVVKMS